MGIDSGAPTAEMPATRQRVPIKDAINLPGVAIFELKDPTVSGIAKGASYSTERDGQRITVDIVPRITVDSKWDHDFDAVVYVEKGGEEVEYVAEDTIAADSNDDIVGIISGVSAVADHAEPKNVLREYGRLMDLIEEYDGNIWAAIAAVKQNPDILSEDQ